MFFYEHFNPCIISYQIKLKTSFIYLWSLMKEAKGVTVNILYTSNKLKLFLYLKKGDVWIQQQKWWKTACFLKVEPMKIFDKKLSRSGKYLNSSNLLILVLTNTTTAQQGSTRRSIALFGLQRHLPMGSLLAEVTQRRVKQSVTAGRWCYHLHTVTYRKLCSISSSSLSPSSEYLLQTLTDPTCNFLTS